MIKVIAFNLWNTLAEKQGKDSLKDIIKAFNVEDIPVFKRKYYETYFTSPWLTKYDAYREICSNNNIEPNEDNIQKMINIANKNLQLIGIYEYTFPLLETLKKSGLKLALLSNSSIFSTKMLKENTKLLEHFDFTLFSYDLGLLKPDLKFYNTLIKITNVLPEEILYIGKEKSKDLKEVKKIGINTITYKDYEQLKKDLVPFGILL